MADTAVCQTSSLVAKNGTDAILKEKADEQVSEGTPPYVRKEGDDKSNVEPSKESAEASSPPVNEEEDVKSIEEPADVKPEEADRSASATWERTPTPTEEEEKNDAAMVFSEHEEAVFSIATFGTQILTGGQDDKAFLWDFVLELEPFEISLEDSVVSVGFSHNGQQFSAASMDGRLVVYESSDPPRLLHTLESGDIEWTEWHPKGEAIAVGCTDGTVWVWCTKTGNNLAVFVGQGGRCTCGKWTIDGRYLVTGHELCYVKLWNPKTGTAKLTFDPNAIVFHEATITSIDTHPKNARLAVSTSADGSARLLSLKKGNVLQVIEHSMGRVRPGIECASFSPFSHLPFLATADLDGHVHITDINRSRLRARVDVGPAGVSILVWDDVEKGMLWASTMEGKIVKIDARSGEMVQTLYGHSMPILDLALVKSPDLRGLVSCGDDSTALIYVF